LNTVSKSISETIDLGVRLGRKLKKGDCVALVGGLGAGKTVFTKGIAKGLGVKGARYVNSPTFVIIKEYSAGGGSAKGGKRKIPLYHFDLYRLDHYTALDGMNYMEYLYGDGVTVIEWGDRIRKLLPKKYIEVKLSVIDENKRKVEIIFR
jgi:tRNA threonylcarbamoyladenosine biosynthesis protein TsaE